MNVELPKTRGHSFMHTVLYVTHDKRPEGAEAHPQTADRVAWAETRNMGGVGPQTGWRVMLDTFRNRDALKEAAGIKSTKAATAGPVYHFSINWHPDERGGNPSKTDMLAAADRVLKVMGAEHLQAVMTAHTDTGNPHLHVVLSLVCPNTGRMHAIGKNKGYELDRWSHDFEIEGGQIYSHDRAAKFADRDKKKQQHPDPDDRRKHIEEQKAKAAAAEQARAEQSDQAKAWSDAAGPKPPSKGALLKAKADALAARHKAERGADYGGYKNGKDALWKERPNIKGIAAAHRVETKPDWSAFGKYQAAERKKFYANERTFLGTFANARAYIERNGWSWGMKGYLGALFGAASQPKEWRVEQMTKYQAAEKATFAAGMNAKLDAKIAVVKAAHAAKLDALNMAYDATKRATAARQADERGAMSAEWKEHYALLEQIQQRRPYHRSRFPAPKNPAHRQEKARFMKDKFENANRFTPSNTPARPITAPVAAPQPTPMGAAPAPAPRQPVQNVDRAADFAASKHGKEVVARQAGKATPEAAPSNAPVPSPNKDIWAKSATPEPTQRPTDIWNEKAKPTADRRHRDRSKDLDFDLDR